VRELTVTAVVDVDDRVNLTDPVWTNADEHPGTVQFVRRDRPAEVLLSGGAEVVTPGAQEVTCGQFRDEVVAVARGLIAAGLQSGDRIALMSKTRYEWTLLDYAIWAAGAVTVPIYETSSREQIEWILADSGAVAVLVETAAHRADVDAVRGALTDLKMVWCIDSGAVDELVDRGTGVPADEVAHRRRTAGADDLATIIYTSGTTGRPKGCMLTHRNIYSDIANAIPGLDNIFHEGAATLLFLPLAHSFARLIQVGVVAGRVRTTHSSDTRNLVADLGVVKPTFVLAVPRVFEKVYNTARQRAHADGKGAIFDRAERVAVAYSESLERGGPGLVLRAQHALFDRLVYGRLRAPLGTRLAHFYRGIGLTIYEGYGLTETSPAIAVNLARQIRIGSVGRPLPGVSIKIADDGEIAVRGDIVFPGYWHNDDATAEAKDADGWFHTGDLGQLDADGYLSITGRKKELIVTAGGKNVAPAVLEDRIRAHALVSQCLVVGDGQPFIAALVTIDEDALPDWKARHGKPAGASVADLREDPDLVAEVQSAIDDANRAVSKAESIRVFRILPGDFTETNGMLTPSLKVKRTVVAKEYADEIAAIYR
jgi:long-chain acyl-CoA synthetase